MKNPIILFINIFLFLYIGLTQLTHAKVSSDAKNFESAIKVFEKMGGKGKRIEVHSPYQQENFRMSQLSQANVQKKKNINK